MNAKTVAIIAVRILALYLIVLGLAQLPNISVIVRSFADYDEKTKQLVYVVLTATIAPVVIGIITWILSPSISRLVLRDIKLVKEESVNAFQLQAIVLASAGVIILVHTIPQLMNIVLQALNAHDPAESDFRMSTFFGASFWAALVKVVLALSLVVGSTGWVKLITKLRGAGLK